MQCKCVNHTSHHSRSQTPATIIHSCYIHYHSSTFILTSITYPFNTLNTRLTHDSFIQHTQHPHFIHNITHQFVFNQGSVDKNNNSLHFKSQFIPQLSAKGHQHYIIRSIGLSKCQAGPEINAFQVKPEFGHHNY